MITSIKKKKIINNMKQMINFYVIYKCILFYIRRKYIFFNFYVFIHFIKLDFWVKSRVHL